MAMHYSAIPFFFLPRGIVATVLPITGGRALLFSFAQVGRLLFTEACWAARWTIRRLKSQERRLIARLFRRDRSDGRTMPDRTGH